MRPPSLPQCLRRQSARRIYSSLAANGALAYEECDVAIVGGGPVGLALAGALNSSKILRENLRIALIEASDLDHIRNWEPVTDNYSSRVIMITNISYAFLRDIGAWEHVQNERTCPVKKMQIWDGISGTRVSFDAIETTRKQFEGTGHLTEHLNLQRGLLRLLDKTPAVDMIHGTRVTSIDSDSKRCGSWPIVNLSNGRRLRARLLVGADGSNSPVRNYAQISSFGWSYDTPGIAGTVIHRPRGVFEGPNTTIYQRFLPTGPIAFMPLSSTVSSFGWSNKPHIIKALQAVDLSVLASMVNAAFRLPHKSVEYLCDQIYEAQTRGMMLTGEQIREEILWQENIHAIDRHSTLSTSSTFSAIGIPPTDSKLYPPLITSVQPGSVAFYPLMLRHAESYLGEGAGARTVLIGDAAHIIHPVSGQGLNLGLADVECLSRCIETAVVSGSDIGSYMSLRSYSRERYLKNFTMLTTVDQAHKIVHLGSVLEVVNESEPLKRALMTAAGGGVGLPRDCGRISKGGEALYGAAHVMQTLGGYIKGIFSDGGLVSIMKRHH